MYTIAVFELPSVIKDPHTQQMIDFTLKHFEEHCDNWGTNAVRFVKGMINYAEVDFKMESQRMLILENFGAGTGLEHERYSGKALVLRVSRCFCFAFLCVSVSVLIDSMFS